MLIIDFKNKMKSVGRLIEFIVSFRYISLLNLDEKLYYVW